MTDIYELHEKAFARVSAFVILRGGERVATIAFKPPADGAGRLYAYVHWLGVPMVRGYAGGYGYDKRTAACADAAGRITKAPGPEIVPSSHFGLIAERRRIRKEQEAREAFTRALEADRGPSWDSALRNAGFTVLQAV